MTDRYDSECGKDAWKKWRRIVESIESPIQDMLHEFGAEMYEQGQRDMLAKCIAEVERIHSPIRIDDDLSYCRKCADAAYGEYSYAWPCAVVTSVRALQQPSGPIEDLTDEEADAYYEALQEKP